MLAEQDIATAAEALLNSASFTTEVSRMVAMLDQTTTDYEFDRLARYLVSDAQRAAEDVQQVVIPTVTGWVRHLVPPSCSRCAILAGRTYRWSDGFKRHPGCDCIHVPTGENSPDDMTVDVDALFERGLVRDLSKADIEAYRDGADLASIVNLGRKRAGLREAGEVLVRDGRLTPAAIRNQAGNDRGRRLELLEENGYLGTSRRRSASGSSGGGGGREIPRTSSAEPDPPDDDLPAWRRRQDAIDVDFKGDVLKPWEVRSVERLVRRGEVIDWIADDRTTSTPDFNWESRGVDGVEMKSTKARVETIRTRILDAASAAMRNHQVVKENFLIDIGHAELTDDLRRELEGYNFAANGEPRRKYRLARLWVLSRDGAELDEIQLRK